MKNSNNLRNSTIKFAWNVAFYSGILIGSVRRARSRLRLLAQDTIQMLEDTELKDEMFKDFFKRAVIAPAESGTRKAKVTRVVPDGSHMTVVFFTVIGTGKKASGVYPNVFAPNVGDIISYNGDDNVQG